MSRKEIIIVVIGLLICISMIGLVAVMLGRLICEFFFWLIAICV